MEVYQAGQMLRNYGYDHMTRAMCSRKTMLLFGQRCWTDVPDEKVQELEDEAHLETILRLEDRRMIRTLIQRHETLPYRPESRTEALHFFGYDEDIATRNYVKTIHVFGYHSRYQLTTHAVESWSPHLLIETLLRVDMNMLKEIDNAIGEREDN